nr:hypothetical protein [Tanacetum cinerariifolium]
MGDEHIDTIPTTKSDEFLKSSFKNFVPNPSESEGENGCDMPACESFTTFSNILFNADYDFYSSDDQSFSDEDLPKEIYSNLLFYEEIIPMKIDPHSFDAESDLIESMLNHDSSIIISSKIDSLFDEFAGELTFLKSIPPRIEETDCYPEEETHLPRDCCTITHLFVHRNNLFLKILMLKLNLSLHLLSPLRIVTLSWKKLIYPLLRITQCRRALRKMTMTLKGIFQSLKNCLTIIPFHFLKKSHSIINIPSFSRPLAKPPDGNAGTLNIKMMGDISEQKVPMPKLMITHVSNQEKSPDLLSHKALKFFSLLLNAQ